MNGTRARTREQEASAGLAIEALMDHIEERRHTRDLVDHDPALDAFRVERIMQRLRTRTERTGERPGTQVEEQRLREPLSRDRGLPRSPWAEQEARTGRRAESPLNGRLRCDEWHHLLILDSFTV